MSNAFLRTDAGSLPTVPTSFPTDNGTAIPAANVLNVNGVDSSVDNANGIFTQANPNLSDNLEIVLSNRLQGTATSTNASNADIVTFTLGASPSVYRFNFDIAGRDTSTGDGVGYTLTGSAKTTGAAATIIEVENTDDDEDASLATSEIDLVASGNSIILRANGPAASTVSYVAVGYYVVV